MPALRTFVIQHTLLPVRERGDGFYIKFSELGRFQLVFSVDLFLKEHVGEQEDQHRRCRELCILLGAETFNNLLRTVLRTE
jgi:hypothetical protein